MLTCVSVKAEGPHPCSQPSSSYGRIAQSSSYPHKTAHHDAVILRYMEKYAQAPCTGLGSSVTKLWGHDLYSRCFFLICRSPFCWGKVTVWLSLRVPSFAAIKFPLLPRLSHILWLSCSMGFDKLLRDVSLWSSSSHLKAQGYLSEMEEGWAGNVEKCLRADNILHVYPRQWSGLI